MQKLPNREIEICRRLRAFREATKISRTRFALEIGIGSERLASYESARVPVRYETFQAVTRKFNLSPRWLASHEGGPFLDSPFDDSEFSKQINPRGLFSEVYDSVLAGPLKLSHDAVQPRINALLKNAREIFSPAAMSKVSESDRAEVASKVESTLKFLRDIIERSEAVESRLKKNSRKPPK